MVRTFVIGQKGNMWSGRTVNNNDPNNTTPIDVTGGTPMIIFYLPDTSILEVQAEFDPDDDTPTDGKRIQFIDNDPNTPSILDQVGLWEYAPAIRFGDGNYILSPDHDIFWVAL